MWAKAQLRLPWSLAAGAGLLSVGGLSATLALTWPETKAKATAPAAVQIAGETVPDAADPLAAARMLAQTVLSREFSVVYGPSQVRASLAALGARIEVTHLATLLRQSSDAGSALRRLHDHHLPNQPLELPLPLSLREGKALPFLKELKDQVDRSPRDARVDPRKQVVVASEAGLELDLLSTLVAVESAMRRGQTRAEAIVLTREPARKATEYAGLDMSDVLAVFETPYNRADVAGDRTHNLKVTASKIDGLVIGAGEVFDFNATVGDRTRANGFRNATVISDGKLVEGMGGGTCQIASTLNAAVLFAGLPILTRNPHSRPSYYIKLGLDAAVAYGSLNFRFKNDRKTPVVIDATVRDGVARIALRGAQQDRSVTFSREIKRALPFEETVIEEESLPRGLQVLSQRGVPGFEVRRERIIRDADGHILESESSADLYPPTTQILRVGRGPEADAAFTPPENDGHPEYVADEFLTAVRPLDSTELRVTAKPGRFGSYGWTQREGMDLSKAEAP